jgi:hypothetical protein
LGHLFVVFPEFDRRPAGAVKDSAACAALRKAQRLALLVVVSIIGLAVATMVLAVVGTT